MDEFSSSSAARRRAQMEQQRKAVAKREADLKAVLSIVKDVPEVTLERLGK